MSQLKVNTIRHTGASSDAIELATDGTCTAKITNNLSNRNLIINGAMQVAQRGTSSTSTGYQTVDRFGISASGQDEAPTMAQASVASGTTPYTLGFRKSLKITNGNQTSGAGAADYYRIYHVIEAQNIDRSGWNTLSASSNLTLSFWVKSSVAQNFYGYLRSQGSSYQNYPFETGSLTANTWTKITKTIPGNSSITFDMASNAGGATLFFDLFDGTNLTGSVTLNQWGAYSGSLRVPNYTSTWYTTNDATFEITGVQLEVGDFASSFEFRSYGDELARCQRYCYEHLLGANQYASIMLGGYYNSSRIYGSIKFPVTMRTAPTMVCTDIADGFNCYRDGGVDFVNEFHIDSANNVGPNAAEILNDTDASGTAGHATIIRRGSNSTTTFRFEAEL